MHGISFLIIFLALALVIIFAAVVLGFLRLPAAGEQARLLVEKQVELSGQLGQMATEATMRQEQLRSALDTRLTQVTTLMATLNTVRAVLKDTRMREQAGVIQAEVGRLANDVGRLDDRG